MLENWYITFIKKHNMVVLLVILKSLVAFFYQCGTLLTRERTRSREAVVTIYFKIKLSLHVMGQVLH